MNSASSSKLDRKTVERNRRTQMNYLCFNLASLIPRDHKSTKEDILHHAAKYIKELRQRVEELKRRKQLAMNINGISNNDGEETKTVVEMREFGDSLEVILISGLNKDFKFNEVISIHAEEGAEVVNASFSVVGDKVFHTIHSQATSSRVGVETSRLYQRLKELVL